MTCSLTAVNLWNIGQWMSWKWLGTWESDTETLQLTDKEKRAL